MKRYAELRGLMAANDYLVPQLARKIGICRASMSNKLNGESGFTLAEAYKIMAVFRQPIDRLHEIFPPDGRKEAP